MIPKFMRTYRHWWPFPGAIVLIIIGSLIATIPLWRTTGLPNSDDSLTHIFNLFQLDEQIAAGEWYPLRFPAAGLGYGYAVLAYYPPLAYYGVELIRLFGADLVLAYKVGLTLITVLAGLTTFALGVALADAYGGLLIAFLYLVSPYFLANLHERGALAEQLGLALGPLLLLTIGRTVQQPGWRSYLLTSFTIALLTLSHFVSTLLFLPLAALYGLWLLSRTSAPKRWRSAGVLAVAGITGATLSAFYWLPAAVESAGRRIFDQSAMLAAYLAELMPVNALLRPSWLIGYENRHAIPELGTPFLLLLVITLLLVVSQLFRRRQGSATWAFFAVVGVLGLLSVTIVAAPVWRLLPALALLQFPFRWLGPASLACAIAIGGALRAAFPSRQRYVSWLAGGGIIGLLGWYGYANLYHLPTQPAMLRSAGVAQVTAQAIHASGLRAYEYDLADNAREQCWFWAYEYIPATSSLSNCETMRDTILQSPPITSTLPAVAAQLQPHWFTPNELVAQVTAAHPWQLTLHAFWLPGWQATIDQQPLVPTAVAPLGVVGLAVPAGVHEIRLHYGPTPLRQALRWVALIAWLGWIGVAFYINPRLTGAGLVGIALAGALFWQHGALNRQPPWQPINVDFNRLIALQGFRVAQEGEQLQLALAWLAQQSTPQSYKVFVHVIDDTGMLWTQADSRPVAYASNTNRWLPGQVILDQHSLPLPAAMPAGRYQVRVGLYAEQDGQRLPVVNEQGTVVDDQLLLGYVMVQR